MREPIHMFFVSLLASCILIASLLYYRYIFPKKNISYLSILICVSLLPLISLLRPGTYESGLLSEHVKYAIPFYNQLSSGIIIPRMIPGACSGYECPYFILQYPLPDYLASAFHFFGMSFLASMKAILAVAYVASGITMFFWAKSEFGEKSAFAVSLFYLFAPYHLETMHFRVSTGEVLSFIFPPLVFLFSKLIIETKKIKFVFLNALCVGLLILSHQATALFSIPLAVIYCLVKIPSLKTFLKTFPALLCSLFMGALYSSWYWIPAIFEGGKFTRAANQKGVIFQPLWYSFYSPLSNRLGLLFQGHNGELYTNIGYAHLFIFLIFTLFLIKIGIKKVDKKMCIFLLVSFLSLTFLMQKLSEVIWENLPLIKNIGDTFRLLVEIAFITSAMSGFVFKRIKNNFFYIIICLFVVFSTILNWGNRGTLSNVTDYTLLNEPLYAEAPCRTELSTPIWVDPCSPWVGAQPKNSIEILNGNA